MTNLHHTQAIDRPSADTNHVEQPYLSLQGEARWYGNSLWEFLVPAGRSGGKLSVFQATMPEGFSPPRHIHTREDEVFHILEGEAWFEIDGERHLAGLGAVPFDVPTVMAEQIRLGTQVVGPPMAAG